MKKNPQNQTKPNTSEIIKATAADAKQTANPETRNDGRHRTTQQAAQIQEKRPKAEEIHPKTRKRNHGPYFKAADNKRTKSRKTQKTSVILRKDCIASKNFIGSAVGFWGLGLIPRGVKKSLAAIQAKKFFLIFKIKEVTIWADTPHYH